MNKFKRVISIMLCIFAFVHMFITNISAYIGWYLFEDVIRDMLDHTNESIKMTHGEFKETVSGVAENAVGGGGGESSLGGW
jgi:hypothetical protein